MGQRGCNACATNERNAPAARDKVAGSSTHAITIPLEIPDFEQLERLATEHNIGNATLGREIIRKYLERKAKRTD